MKALSVSKFTGNIYNLFEDPTLSETRSLELEYLTMLNEFNKNFIIDNIHKISITSLIRYLAYSIGDKSMNKEFIDAMKLDIDAPRHY